VISPRHVECGACRERGERDDHTYELRSDLHERHPLLWSKF
jgi:hypothetical protein